MCENSAANQDFMLSVIGTLDDWQNQRAHRLLTLQL